MFVFRVIRGGKVLYWDALERAIGGVSTGQFQQSLPLPLYEGEDCIDNVTVMRAQAKDRLPV